MTLSCLTSAVAGEDGAAPLSTPSVPDLPLLFNFSSFSRSSLIFS